MASTPVRKLLTFIALRTAVAQGVVINADSSLDRKDLTAEWITLPDFLTLLDPNLNNNAGHSGTDGSWVTGGFLA
jgi:hypothetical protein